jgi:hypothetical protein
LCRRAGERRRSGAPVDLHGHDRSVDHTCRFPVVAATNRPRRDEAGSGQHQQREARCRRQRNATVAGAARGRGCDAIEVRAGDVCVERLVAEGA